MSAQRAFQSVPPRAEQANGDRDGADLLTQTEVCRRLGKGVETWRRWRRAGLTPEAVRLPSGRPAWRRVDIDRLVGLTPMQTGRRYFQSAQRVVHTRDSQPHPFPMKGRTL